MSSRTKERIFIGICILVLVMVNPPALTMVNNYAIKNPMIGSYPTVWIWLQLWYWIGIIAFVIAAFTIPSWKKEYREDED